jgi:inner membrane protein
LHFSTVLIAGVALGSLLPDIDEPKSKVGRKAPILSHGIKLFFGHRGITHTLLASIIVGSLLFYFSKGFPSPLAIGLTIGYLFHILEDALSIEGVPLLFPITKKHFGIPIYRTGGLREYVILVVTLLWIGHLRH